MRSNIEKTPLENLLDSDFRYSCEYDYTNETHCSDRDCDGDICRGSTIENFIIKEIHFDLIVDKFVDILAEDDFTIYCIERVCNALKLWNVDNWEYSICGGYYGQEIKHIKINSETQQELKKWLTTVTEAKTNKEKLFTALELEYGYVLEELKEIWDWDIVKDVPLHLIIAGQAEHYKKLDRKIVDKYSDYKLPIGVCITKNDGSYRLIDGYHRLRAMSNKKGEVEKVSIVVGVTNG
jgi:hypothetical protein